MADELTTAIIEIRLLLRAFIDTVDPPLHAAVDHPENALDGCTGCPICSFVSSVRGENREFVAALATHSLRIIDLLREYAAEPETPTEPRPPDPEPRSGGHGFVPIEIQINR